MAHCATQTDPFEVLLRTTADAVPNLRQAFEKWLHDAGVGDEPAGELSVVFSELVTNAIQASNGAGQEIEVAAWTEEGKVMLCVANPISRSSAPVTIYDLDDPFRTGGRGLLIVRAFTDAMTIEFDDGSIVVRCERRIRSSAQRDVARRD